ncbi:MAG TPA: hypothetical protein PLQ67_08645 [Burkholderiaceae bacterium]|nr:hypothetical protein [Burkholderiaceae bacterium]
MSVGRLAMHVDARKVEVTAGAGHQPAALKPRRMATTGRVDYALLGGRAGPPTPARGASADQIAQRVAQARELLVSSIDLSRSTDHQVGQLHSVRAGKAYALSSAHVADQAEKLKMMQAGGLNELPAKQLIELSLYNRLGPAVYYSPFAPDAYHVERDRTQALFAVFENGPQVVRAHKTELEGELGAKQAQHDELSAIHHRVRKDLEYAAALRQGLANSKDQLAQSLPHMSSDDIDFIVEKMGEGIELGRNDPRFLELETLKLELDALKARLLAIDENIFRQSHGHWPARAYPQ